QMHAQRLIVRHTHPGGGFFYGDVPGMAGGERSAAGRRLYGSLCGATGRTGRADALTGYSCTWNNALHQSWWARTTSTRVLGERIEPNHSRSSGRKPSERRLLVAFVRSSSVWATLRSPSSRKSRP